MRRCDQLECHSDHIEFENENILDFSNIIIIFVEWIDGKIMDGGEFGCSFNNGLTASSSRADGGGGSRWEEFGGEGLGSSTGNVPDPTWSVSAFASEAAPHMQQQQQHIQNNPSMNDYYGQQMT